MFNRAQLKQDSRYAAPLSVAKFQQIIPMWQPDELALTTAHKGI
jgi:predicted transcriptional regulator